MVNINKKMFIFIDQRFDLSYNNIKLYLRWLKKRWELDQSVSMQKKKKKEKKSLLSYLREDTRRLYISSLLVPWFAQSSFFNRIRDNKATSVWWLFSFKDHIFLKTDSALFSLNFLKSNKRHVVIIISLI